MTSRVDVTAQFESFLELQFQPLAALERITGCQHHLELFLGRFLRYRT
jgi:hypothetical protein